MWLLKDLRFPTVALVGNPADPRLVDTLGALAQHFAAQSVSVFVADSMPASSVPSAVRIPEHELALRARLMIAVGGDGTMLYAARRIAGRQVPLLGINRGRLGFLADLGPTEMFARLDEILRGEYDSDSRLLLKTEILTPNGTLATGLALNDVVVIRHDPGRMLEVQTFVNGRYLNTHSGDGFIVATATGSTAYALSCGGPIVDPSLDAILLVPICPHTLSERPIIVPATAVTEIRLRQDHPGRAEVSCDGEAIGDLAGGRGVTVRAARERIELIHPRGYDHFHILRSKLRWGRDNHPRAGEQTEA
jgi:NAD+ kinase